MTPVEVALVGYGGGGATFHAPVIAAVPGLRLTTVVTSRAADVARDLPGVRAVALVEAAFADPAIELVIIATPNGTHHELARQALRAGKHVVLDKPMTVTTAQADDLIATAATAGKALSVYHNRRWDGDYLTVERCVRDGSLGTVFLCEIAFDRFRPVPKIGWREEPQPGSGLLYDLGPHLVDQAVQLFGLPQTVVADIAVQRPNARVDDYFNLCLRYGERRVTLRASALVCAPGAHFALHGDAGSFTKSGMDPQEAALKAGTSPASPGFGEDTPERYGTLVRADGTRTRVPTMRGEYTAFYAAIAAAIRAAQPLPVSAADARNVIAVIEAALRSARDGRAVAVSP